VPGYIVSREEELRMSYYGNSPLSNDAHPSRPAQVVKEIVQESAKTGQSDTKTEVDNNGH
jgi:small subunit ribosomal protein S4